MTHKPLGRIAAIVRYPVKSIAGVPAESAHLGWHGIAGDRRFAFRRLDDVSGFPWLSASRLPELLLYHPLGLEERSAEPLATHVRTPGGAQLPLRSPELSAEISERLGSPVEVMHFRNGFFDDGAVSVIARHTIAGIGRRAGRELDPRRFRANILLDTDDPTPFAEDAWVGGRLVFGHDGSGPAVSVTARDVRCMIINLDPDTATQDARVLKAVVQLNANNAGVYGTVVQTGTISVGQPVSLVGGPA